MSENDTFSGRPTSVPPEPGGRLLGAGDVVHGRYQIERQLGAGAMGVVYLAEDLVTNARVALKIINPTLVNNPSARRRLIREGLLTRDVRHPNIVSMYDVSEAAGQVYLVMEHLPGESLRAYLRRKLKERQDVSLETAAGIVRAILSGLAAAHERGIIHRDLKPENILLGADPDAGEYRLKILDFGIARATAEDSGLVTTSTSSGTPHYMAPEQKTAADTVGPWSDLYALAVMFYELLVGVLPSGVPASKERPDLPVVVDAIIERGLTSRPQRRYQTASEFLAALDPLTRVDASTRPPVPAPIPIEADASPEVPVVKPEPRVELPVQWEVPPQVSERSQTVRRVGGWSLAYWGGVVVVLGVVGWLDQQRDHVPSFPIAIGAAVVLTIIALVLGTLALPDRTGRLAAIPRSRRVLELAVVPIGVIAWSPWTAFDLDGAGAIYLGLIASYAWTGWLFRVSRIRKFVLVPHVAVALLAVIVMWRETSYTVTPIPFSPPTTFAGGLDAVRLPPGTYRRGCLQFDAECHLDTLMPSPSLDTPRTAVIENGFWIGQREVTAAQFRAFMNATGRQSPAPLRTAPIRGSEAVLVTVEEAGAFCRWAGGRLPNDEEWEYAARAGERGDSLLRRNGVRANRLGLEYSMTNIVAEGVVRFGVMERTGLIEGATAAFRCLWEREPAAR